MKERNRGRAQELSQSQGQEHRPSLHRVTTAPGASWQHSPIHSLHIKAEPLLNGVCFPPGTGFQGDSFIFSLRRDKITGEAKNNQQPPLAMSRLKPGGIWLVCLAGGLVFVPLFISKTFHEEPSLQDDHGLICALSTTQSILRVGRQCWTTTFGQSQLYFPLLNSTAQPCWQFALHAAFLAALCTRGLLTGANMS